MSDRFAPRSPEALAAELAERLTRHDSPRVLLDGPRADVLAEHLAGRLASLGRPAVRVSARDFQRPAGERYQHGREDPLSFRDRWTDTGALRREALERFRTGSVVRALRDPATDRSVHAAPVAVPERAVLLVDGLFLLGLGLPAELVVHVALSPGALLRWGAQPWQVEAFASYDEEVDPGVVADVLVRWDDPRRPAVRCGGDR